MDKMYFTNISVIRFFFTVGISRMCERWYMIAQGGTIWNSDISCQFGIREVALLFQGWVNQWDLVDNCAKYDIHVCTFTAKFMLFLNKACLRYMGQGPAHSFELMVWGQ